MFPSLQEKLKRFTELELQLQDPEVLSDTSQLLAIQREYGGLSKVAVRTREFNQLEDDVQTAV
ncbi:MAG: peptide chain release factor 1, partial [Planctomycetaceae bacterium]